MVRRADDRAWNAPDQPETLIRRGMWAEGTRSFFAWIDPEPGKIFVGAMPDACPQCDAIHDPAIIRLLINADGVVCFYHCPHCLVGWTCDWSTRVATGTMVLP